MSEPSSQERPETSAASPEPPVTPTRVSKLATGALASSVVGLSLVAVALFAHIEWPGPGVVLLGLALMVLGVGLGLVATNRVHRSHGRLHGRSQGIAAALVGCLPIPAGLIAAAYFIFTECQ